MITQLQSLNIWLSERDGRERLLLFIMLLALTNFIWTIFVDRPLTQSQKQLANQALSIQSDTDALRAQETSIIEIVNKSSYENKIEQKNKLTNESKNFKQRIIALMSTIVPADKLPYLLTEILSLKQGVDFVSLRNLPVEPWVPEALSDEQLPYGMKKIYKYSWTLEFRSDYFGAIDYLTRLEHLPWHIYWDSLSYAVNDYPKATVVVTFHVMSDKGEGG